MSVCMCVGICVCVRRFLLCVAVVFQGGNYEVAKMKSLYYRVHIHCPKERDPRSANQFFAARATGAEGAVTDMTCALLREASWASASTRTAFTVHSHHT